MKKLVILLLMGWIGFDLQAQSLEDYLKAAAENNPQLKASFHDYLAALEKVPQVGSLPDPEVSFGYFIKPMEFLMGNQRAELSLMQMFPWFGMLRAQKDEASYMAHAQYQSFQEIKNQLFYQVKETWYELYRLEAEIRLMEENLEIMRSYERLALIRFRSGGTSTSSGATESRRNMKSDSDRSGAEMSGSMGGMNRNASSDNNRSSNSSDNSMTSMSGSTMSRGGGMADVLRVQMEIKDMENNLALLKDTRVPLMAKFNLLLNRPAEEPVQVVDTLTAQALPAERLSLLDSIIQNNPMIKMHEAEHLVLETQKKMAKLEGLPMLGVGLNYMIFTPRYDGDSQMSVGGGNMVMPMVSVTLPIYRKKYKAMAKEADLLWQSVINQHDHLENQLTVEWNEALKNLDDAERRVQLYQEQQALAHQALRLLTTAYSTETADFEEVLRMQQQLIDYKLKLITAIVDQNTMVAMIEMLAATELEQN